MSATLSLPDRQLPSSLVIASRESRLALWQAEHVKARLESLLPHCAVRIAAMTTRGDQILDRSLAKVGGKGLFVKELEMALLDGRADLAVHSLKDVPMTLDEQFALAAVMEREDARDALVSGNYASLAELPPGARVGTSSLRRAAQLRERYPTLAIHALRGNLDTRIRKLDEGGFEAIILAAAGLRRLGLADRIRGYLDFDECLPAPGQGALGIEIGAHRTELFAVLALLNDPRTAAAVRAERAVSRGLGGSCTVALAAHAVFSDPETLWLRALVAREDGSEVLRCQAHGPAVDPEGLGQGLATELIENNALALITPA